jgi:hypothetical protein
MFWIGYEWQVFARCSQRRSVSREKSRSSGTMVNAHVSASAVTEVRSSEERVSASFKDV